MSTAKSPAPLTYACLTALLAGLSLAACSSPGPNRSPALETSSVRLLASAMGGPLDANLPGYARVRRAHVAPAPDACAVVWTRELGSEELEWDDQQKCWRVKGSDETIKNLSHSRPGSLPDGHELPSCTGCEMGSKPSSYVPPPLVGPRGRRLPVDSDFFPPGEYLGSAIIGLDGAQRVYFQGDLGAGNPYDGLRSLVWTGSQWTMAINLRRDLLRDGTGAWGIALSELGNDGWTKARLVIAGRHGELVGLHARSSGLDLFWLEECSRGWDLPEFMGGKGRACLNYTRIEDDGAASTKPVYEETDPARWRDHHVVGLGAGRYDLIVRHEHTPKREDEPDRLIHVADVLGGGLPSGHVIASFDRLSRFVVLGRQRALQVVWLEPQPLGRGFLNSPTSVRLVEAHLQDNKWTKPRVVYEGEPVDCESLAAASSAQGGQDLALVVWRAQSGRLRYLVSSTRDTWTEPQEAELEIGDANWLAACGDKFCLVTRCRGNLYWSWLTLSEDGARQPLRAETQEAREPAP